MKRPQSMHKRGRIVESDLVPLFTPTVQSIPQDSSRTFLHFSALNFKETTAFPQWPLFASSTRYSWLWPSPQSPRYLIVRSCRLRVAAPVATTLANVRPTGAQTNFPIVRSKASVHTTAWEDATRCDTHGVQYQSHFGIYFDRSLRTPLAKMLNWKCCMHGGQHFKEEWESSRKSIFISMRNHLWKSGALFTEVSSGALVWTCLI